MQIFTLYDATGKVVLDQQQVFSASPVPVPAGWTDTTATPSIVVPPPVPASVSMFQARAVLLNTPSPSGTAGRTLFDDVDAGIKAMPVKSVAYQAWEYANDMYRDGALVEQLSGQFNLTSAQLDSLFIAAAQVTA